MVTLCDLNERLAPLASTDKTLLVKYEEAILESCILLNVVPRVDSELPISNNLLTCPVDVVEARLVLPIH